MQPEIRLPEISEDEKNLVSKAQTYREFAAHPGWKLLLDTLARQSDRILAVIKEVPYGKHEELHDLMIEWRAVEKVLVWMQNEVAGTIHDHDNLIREMLKDKLPDNVIEHLVQQTYT